MLLLAASPLALLWLVIYVVVALIVLGLLYWAANKIMTAFGVGDPIRTVVIVLLVIIVVIFILYALFGGGVPSLR